MNQDRRAGDCIFCKIIAGEMPAEIVYQDDEVICIRDINPIAPVHLLVIPRAHIPYVSDLTEADMPILGHMTAVANKIAGEQGLVASGYRLIINRGEGAGQTIWHLHMHLLGGRKLTWTA